MKQFSNFEAKKATGRETLPAGAYIAKILDAREVSYDWGTIVLLSFDITEGQYKDFFAKDYKNQDREDKKWRGIFRMREPLDDGSENDRWTKRNFQNSIWAIQESNPGYYFDWDESKFVGKSVGVLFRNREWEMNGNTGWTTECCALTSVEDVRNGTYRQPKDKPLPKASLTPNFTPVNNTNDTDSDLPF